VSTFKILASSTWERFLFCRSSLILLILPYIASFLMIHQYYN
jgi:hypothetical protein